MRVIGGVSRGRRLSSLKGLSIRPTSDKVREAVFNILPRDFPFCKVLDLFAGTGAMGIEALSRGAREAVFVDKDPAAASIIKKNAESCGFRSFRILKKDVRSALGLLSGRSESFDLIFIDPPYDSGLLVEAISTVASKRLLNPGGFIVAETSKRAPVPTEFPGLARLDERRYGDTLVYFYTL